MGKLLFRDRVKGNGYSSHEPLHYIAIYSIGSRRIKIIAFWSSSPFRIETKVLSKFDEWSELDGFYLPWKLSESHRDSDGNYNPQEGDLVAVEEKALERAIMILDGV